MEKEQTIKIDYENISKYLKNTSPYLFVDYAEIVPGKSGVGTKLFTHNEWFFNSHFPGNPLVPGVFLLETIMQTAALCIHTTNNPLVDYIYFNKLFSAEFPNAVRPGDKLEAHVCIISNRRGIIKAKGEAYAFRNDKKILAGKAEFQQLIAGVLKAFTPNKPKEENNA